MAGLFSERSGIVDISLEGKMLFAAFAAGALAAFTNSPWIALGGGIVISVLMGLLHGFACITNRGDQVVCFIREVRNSRLNCPKSHAKWSSPSRD